MKRFVFFAVVMMGLLALTHAQSNSTKLTPGPSCEEKTSCGECSEIAFCNWCITSQSCLSSTKGCAQVAGKCDNSLHHVVSADIKGTHVLEEGPMSSETPEDASLAVTPSSVSAGAVEEEGLSHMMSENHDDNWFPSSEGGDSVGPLDADKQDVPLENLVDEHDSLASSEEVHKATGEDMSALVHDLNEENLEAPLDEQIASGHLLPSAEPAEEFHEFHGELPPPEDAPHKIDDLVVKSSMTQSSLQSLEERIAVLEAKLGLSTAPTDEGDAQIEDIIDDGVQNGSAGESENEPLEDGDEPTEPELHGENTNEDDEAVPSEEPTESEPESEEDIALIQSKEATRVKELFNRIMTGRK